MSRLPIYTTLLIISLLLVNIETGYAAKFYKWTDEQGNVHFSDKEPVSQDAETVHVNAPKPSQTAHQIPKIEAGADDPEQELSKEAQQQKQQEAEQLQNYCKDLQTNIKTLELSGRIQTVDEEGNRKFLGENEQLEKLKTYRSEYATRCKP